MTQKKKGGLTTMITNFPPTHQTGYAIMNSVVQKKFLSRSHQTATLQFCASSIRKTCQARKFNQIKTNINQHAQTIFSMHLRRIIVFSNKPTVWRCMRQFEFLLFVFFFPLFFLGGGRRESSVNLLKSTQIYLCKNTISMTRRTQVNSSKASIFLAVNNATCT